MPDNKPGIKEYLNRTLEALLPLLGLPLALLLGAVMLLALKVNPLTAYSAMLEGAVGSGYAISVTLIKATPLLLVGLGIVIAYRGGVVNIGGEGQLIVGALAATALSIGMSAWPRWALLPMSLIVGVLAGAVWGSVPGLLKSRIGVNEILSTVMMNSIALQFSNFLLRGPMIDPAELEAGTRIAQSALLPEQVWLTRMAPPIRLHSGAILAVVMAFLVYIFLWRTTIGYRIRAVGLNPHASRYAGIPVPFYQALCLILGGSFAGLAGAVEVMGLHHRMMEGVSSGYGFSGIVAALFGKLHPLGAIPASVLFGGLLVGGNQMQRAVQVPSALIDAILGLVVLFVVSADIYSRKRARRREING
ncbi:MAG: ABC transporter permease [Anaerolineaceae bacterium]|jgi:simple sugar transport system permease protein|nr:ABC transporter permease [Anaerolineaceae bacterium]